MRDSREIERWSQQIAGTVNNLTMEVNQLQQFRESVMNKQQLDSARDLIAKLQEQSVSYNNLIIAVGYAGFFAFWTSLENEMPNLLHAAAGLLTVLSLLTFIAWEVTKMIWRAIHLNGVQTSLASENPSPMTVAKFQEALSSFDRQAHRIWLYFLVPSIVLGLGGGGCLLGFFVCELWRSVA